MCRAMGQDDGPYRSHAPEPPHGRADPCVSGDGRAPARPRRRAGLRHRYVRWDAAAAPLCTELCNGRQCRSEDMDLYVESDRGERHPRRLPPAGWRGSPDVRDRPRQELGRTRAVAGRRFERRPDRGHRTPARRRIEIGERICFAGSGSRRSRSDRRSHRRARPYGRAR